LIFYNLVKIVGSLLLADIFYIKCVQIQNYLWWGVIQEGKNPIVTLNFCLVFYIVVPEYEKFTNQQLF
jgi:hypothetical protein